MTYTVYIAAPYPMRDQAIALMQQLEAAGFPVNASWLRGSPLTDAEAAEQIQHLAEVDQADWLVLLNPKEWANAGTGGRHTEFGYALKGGKTLFVVGEPSNIFHYPTHRVYTVTDQALLLSRMRMELKMIELGAAKVVD